MPAAALYQLIGEAYGCYYDSGEELKISDWIKWQREKEPQFLYWHQALELQLLVLAHVKSSRIGDFKLYMETIEHLMAWVFSTDQSRYNRNLPVHLRDLCSMRTLHPQVYKEFMEGRFVGHKTNRAFSGLPTDQLHEQQIKILKGDGGIVGITESLDTLIEFMVLAPEYARLITEFEQGVPNTESKHHEQYPKFQSRYYDDIKALTSISLQ